MPAGAVKASVDGTTIAEATEWEEVEGNVYFPPTALKREFFSAETDLHTTCHWKGVASYYDVVVGDKKLENAAWFYPSTKKEADRIKGYVAFYKNKVEITKS